MFKESAFTITTLPASMRYTKSNKKRPRKFNPQGKTWFREECSSREAAMTSGHMPCSSVWQMGVSKENSCSWGAQSKEGSHVGDRDTSRVRPSALVKSQQKVLEKGFKAVTGSWVSCKPRVLCSILRTVTESPWPA